MVGVFFFHSFMYIYIFVHNYCFHSIFWPWPSLIFPTASQHLSYLSMCQLISYFSLYSQSSSLPICLPLQFRLLSRLSTILPSLFPPSLHLPSFPSLLSPSFLSSSTSKIHPPPSPSSVSKAVYWQLQSHLSVQFIFPCSLWGQSKRKNHRLPS